MSNHVVLCDVAVTREGIERPVVRIGAIQYVVLKSDSIILVVAREPRAAPLRPRRRMGPSVDIEILDSKKVLVPGDRSSKMHVIVGVGRAVPAKAGQFEVIEGDV